MIKLQTANCKSAILVLVLTSFALADSIFVGSLERKAATIIEIKDESLVFDINGRRADPVPLARVTKLIVVGEPAFNAAEEAYSVGKPVDSIEGYLKTLRAATKPWMKDFAIVRLLDVAAKTDRFDAACTAYIALLLKDPALAAKHKPAMPDSRSTYLDSGITETNAALATPGLADEQRIALLGFMVDLQNARRDPAAADATTAKLDELLAKDPNNPQAARAMVRRKLQATRVLLERRDFNAVIKEIDSGRAMFIDPPQQAEALFLLAEARSGLAVAAKDAALLKDAALAYMRVIAHFKDSAGRPFVAESLLRAGELQELLSDPTSAIQMYEQIVSQYPENPAAEPARRNLERLHPSNPR